MPRKTQDKPIDRTKVVGKVQGAEVREGDLVERMRPDGESWDYWYTIRDEPGQAIHAEEVINDGCCEGSCRITRDGEVVAPVPGWRPTQTLAEWCEAVGAKHSIHLAKDTCRDDPKIPRPEWLYPPGEMILLRDFGWTPGLYQLADYVVHREEFGIRLVPRDSDAARHHLSRAERAAQRRREEKAHADN